MMVVLVHIRANLLTFSRNDCITFLADLSLISCSSAMSYRFTI